jgi:hypothetical protein
MSKYCLKIILILLTVIFAATAFAASSSTNYKITHEIVDSGGGESSSSTYNVQGKARERSIGTPFSNLYKLFEGFIAAVFGLDRNAPASINNLAASGGTNAGEIDLTWTAVGDDGNTGTAASYIVKYSSSPITTQSQFDSATTYTQSWTPLQAGSAENETLTALNPGDLLYFAIVAVDEAGNQGDISNSPNAIVKVPPDVPVQLVTPPAHTPKVFDPEDPAGLTIEYALNKNHTIIITIFDIQGRLFWKRSYPAGSQGGQEGTNAVVWNGISDFYGTAPNGVYIYHILYQENGAAKSLGKGKVAVFR